MSWLTSLLSKKPPTPSPTLTNATTPSDSSSAQPPLGASPDAEQPSSQNRAGFAPGDTEKRDSMKRGSQTVVLLDGDADYFHSSYLSQGFMGGTRAAVELHRQVKAFIATKDGVAGSTGCSDVLALCFLNVSGLENYLHLSLRPFVHGFNSSPFALSMVDTGGRSQSADESLKSEDYLTFHITTTDYILMGGTHDGGYAATLHRLDPELVRRKVILLRTTPFCAPRLADFGLEEATFPGLFQGRDPRGPNYGRGGQQQKTSAPNSSSGGSPPRRAASLPSGKEKDRGSERSSNGSTKSSSPPSSPSPHKSAPPPSPPTSSRSAPPKLKLQSSSPSPSPLIVPPKFRGLVDHLEELRRTGDARPLRSSVGSQLGMVEPKLYSTSFKQYAAEAEKAGLVRFGGKGPESEWIELALSSAQLRLQHSPKSSTPTGTRPSRLPITSSAPHSSSPFALPLQPGPIKPSTSPSIQRFTLPASRLPPLHTPTTASPFLQHHLTPAAPAHELTPFQPLLMILRQQAQLGNRTPSALFLQAQLHQLGSTSTHIFDRGGEGCATWLEYLEKAEQRGVVKTGGEREDKWVALK